MMEQIKEAHTEMDVLKGSINWRVGSDENEWTFLTVFKEDDIVLCWMKGYFFNITMT